MKSSVKRTICIAAVVVVAVCAALAAHFFPGRSAGDIPDIVRASADEDDVNTREGRAVVHVNLHHLRLYATPGHAALEDENVSRVSVQVQEIRI